MITKRNISNDVTKGAFCDRFLVVKVTACLVVVAGTLTCMQNLHRNQLTKLHNIVSILVVEFLIVSIV